MGKNISNMETNRAEPRRRFDIRELPVMYSHFLLVCCVLIMSILMLIVHSRISLKTLTEKNLAEMQYRLEQNCKTISDTFGEAHSIPSIIQQTRYYDYIKGVDMGYLPDKYAAVVAYLGKSLQIPNYLSSESDECLIYLRGVNSICSKKRVFINAEDCFSQYMRFADTDSASVMELLRSKDGLIILPMQEVKIDVTESKRQMAVIVSPSDVPISVLCTYSEEALMRHLEMELLPENTYLQITSNDGRVLEAYPDLVTDEVRKNSYELKASMPFLKAQTTMWIPESYFSALLDRSNTISWMIICLTALLGLALSMVLARISSKPIRELVSRHAAQGPVDYHANEIRYLGNLIEHSKNEAEAMEQILFSNLLMRALSGSVLSEADVNRLKQRIGAEDRSYRVAIFQLSQDVSQMQVVNCLRERLTGDFFCEPISEREVGILFLTGEGQVERLKEEIQKMDPATGQEGPRLCGGVSGPVENLNNFHIAVRQARVAMMRQSQLNVFVSTASNPAAVSWLQHERLYQSILSGDEENSILILGEIAQDVHGGSSGREAFYNVRFVLRSAAEELDLSGFADDKEEYLPDVPPWENVERLKKTLRELFVRIQQKHEQSKSGLQEKILDYLAENYSDCSLCTASVAEHFDLSQKSVYAKVRQASGVSFNDYVLSLRMKKAGTLLCTTQLSVGEIAERCGFSAESTFYRVFKKYYDATPKQYRQYGGVLPRETEE